MIRLLVLDFDGTALGGYEPYDRFPDHLSTLLDALSDRGLLWATNTVWHPYAQDQVFQASRVHSRPIRALGRTGLSCGRYLEGQLVLDAAWDYELAEAQARYAIDYLPAVREQVALCPSIVRVDEYVDHILAAQYARTEPARRELSALPLLRQHTYLEYPVEADCVLIFPAHMSKGAALQRIQRQLSLSPEQTLVAADGVNDLTMLSPERARWLVAPANAAPSVKKQVRAHQGLVTERPYSDGIVEGIRTLLARAGQAL